MIKLKSLLVLFFAGILMVSCKEDCEKKGTGVLAVTNTSENTVQRVIVDGVNYGILEPGEKIEITLPIGTYPLLIEGVSGGGGCAVAPLPNVPIIMCETFSIDCSG